MAVKSMRMMQVSCYRGLNIPITLCAIALLKHTYSFAAIACTLFDGFVEIFCFMAYLQVLEIQKLASELGLNCITTYKLDALKAVCRRNDSDISSSSNCAEDTNNSAVSFSNMTDSQIEKISNCDVQGLSVDQTCSDPGRWTHIFLGNYSFEFENYC